MFVCVESDSPGMCDVFVIHSRGAVHIRFREESGNVRRFCHSFPENPPVFVKNPGICDVLSFIPGGFSMFVFREEFGNV